MPVVLRVAGLLVVSCVAVFSGCSSAATLAKVPGRELVRNGSFVQSNAAGNLPAFWEARGDIAGLSWQGGAESAVLSLTATAPTQAVTASQTVELPQPLPEAVKVRATVKREDIRRGEKSWYSGRILVTYLDAAGAVLGDTFTLDRLEGRSDWKEVQRQFPVIAGAARVRLELQLLNPAKGVLRLRNVSLRALNHEEAQAWRHEAEERIRRYRMAPLRIRVEDAAGSPLPGADVAVFMRRHAYPFGTAVQAKMLTAPPGDPHTDAYRAVVGNFFNYTTLENDLKIRTVAKNGMAPALAGLAWLKARGIARRGHVLTWPSFTMASPEEIAAKDDPAKLREVMRREFKLRLEATAPYDIADWDVMNEPAVHNDLIRILGEPQVAEWYRWAAADAPRARLYLNENNVEFQGGNGDNLEQWIRRLRAAGAPLGGLGWQGHMWHRTLPSGQNILDDLDHFEPYGLPVQITEYDANGRFSDADQARFMEEFLTAWFSHPLTAGFIMWGFQDAYMWNGNGPLFRADWSLKPSGKAWMDLVFGKWWTEESGRSDAKGVFETRGFLGDYEVEVRQGGRRVVRAVTLGGDGAEIVVRIDARATADEPATRLVSSNPYRGGKLPAILPPKAKAPSDFQVRSVGVTEGKGAAGLSPGTGGDGENVSGRFALEGNESGRLRRDLYLRFDAGALTVADVDQATLRADVVTPVTQPVRVRFYALSPRFVPQGTEAGLDWQKDDLILGKAPGRDADDGDYRLGDASVLYLGETQYANTTEPGSLSFSSPELARAVGQAADKGVTLIVSVSEGRLPVASPALVLRLKKPVAPGAAK